MKMFHLAISTLCLVAAASVAHGQGVLVDKDVFRGGDAGKKTVGAKVREAEKDRTYIFVPAMIPEGWTGNGLRSVTAEYPGMATQPSLTEEVKELRRLNALLTTKVAQLERELADVRKK